MTLGSLLSFINSRLLIYIFLLKYSLYSYSLLFISLLHLVNYTATEAENAFYMVLLAEWKAFTSPYFCLGS